MIFPPVSTYAEVNGEPYWLHRGHFLYCASGSLRLSALVQQRIQPLGQMFHPNPQLDLCISLGLNYLLKSFRDFLVNVTSCRLWLTRLLIFSVNRAIWALVWFSVLLVKRNFLSVLAYDFIVEIDLCPASPAARDIPIRVVFATIIGKRHFLFLSPFILRFQLSFADEYSFVCPFNYYMRWLVNSVLPGQIYRYYERRTGLARDKCGRKACSLRSHFAKKIQQ
jgi:hypothetical protein